MPQQSRASPNGHPQSPSPYVIASYVLFGIALTLFLMTGVVLDSTLAALPITTQRWIGATTLVLPALIGLLLGVVGLFQPGTRKLVAGIGYLLNALFAAFFTLVLVLAG